MSEFLPCTCHYGDEPYCPRHTSLPGEFACRPCECSGVCDKCRQTESGNPPASPVAEGQRQGTTGMASLPTGPLSVCLCDPDTDAVCDRNCP